MLKTWNHRKGLESEDCNRFEDVKSSGWTFNGDWKWKFLISYQKPNIIEQSLYVRIKKHFHRKTSLPNVGCESIDSSHAIIKMCTAFSHISLFVAHFIEMIRAKEEKNMRGDCVRSSRQRANIRWWKKLTVLKRKGHVKLNVQDGKKVGRTLKNEVWLDFVVDIFISSIFVIHSRVHERSKRET